MGPSGAGKSCLIHRFRKNEFLTYEDPTMEDNFIKQKFEFNHPTDGTKTVFLDIKDTGGGYYESLKDQVKNFFFFYFN